ncbi:hypothetical protein AB1L42_15865 [Thalassoglobus sp. JC818]|uniref:hypothetical protein n=1 Tax=Thalassoglobus sp. JC818 TaxID=3232136 RepID=UPI0034599700
MKNFLIATTVASMFVFTGVGDTSSAEAAPPLRVLRNRIERRVDRSFDRGYRDARRDYRQLDRQFDRRFDNRYDRGRYYGRRPYYGPRYRNGYISTPYFSFGF